MKKLVPIFDFYQKEESFDLVELEMFARDCPNDEAIQTALKNVNWIKRELDEEDCKIGIYPVQHSLRLDATPELDRHIAAHFDGHDPYAIIIAAEFTNEAALFLYELEADE